MDDLEQKLGALLSNPQLMQQIMSMAQSLGQSSPQNTPSSPTPEPTLPNFDSAILQKLTAMAAKSGTSGEEQALLNALSPFLRRERILKLEKAMRAAKLARAASTFLNAGGLQLLTGR